MGARMLQKKNDGLMGGDEHWSRMVWIFLFFWLDIRVYQLT